MTDVKSSKNQVSRYVMEGTINGQPFSREYVGADDHDREVKRLTRELAEARDLIAAAVGDDTVVRRLHTALVRIAEHWGDPLPIASAPRVVIDKWMNDYHTLRRIAREALSGEPTESGAPRREAGDRAGPLVSRHLSDVDLRELLRAYKAARNPTPLFADAVLPCLEELQERRAHETTDESVGCGNCDEAHRVLTAAGIADGDLAEKIDDLVSERDAALEALRRIRDQSAQNYADPEQEAYASRDIARKALEGSPEETKTPRADLPTLQAWLKGCDELIESGVATDMVAVCPVALRRVCEELIGAPAGNTEHSLAHADGPCGFVFKISPPENRCLNCGWRVRNHGSAEKASEDKTGGDPESHGQCGLPRSEEEFRARVGLPPAKATAGLEKCAEHGIPRQFCTGVHAEKASGGICDRHGQIVETGCPDCERALGRRSEPWTCPRCQQINSAGSATCGRCEDL